MVPRARGLGGDEFPCGVRGSPQQGLGRLSAGHCPLSAAVVPGHHGHSPSRSAPGTSRPAPAQGVSPGAAEALGHPPEPGRFPGTDAVSSPQGEDGPPGNGTEGFPGFPVSPRLPAPSPPLVQPGRAQDHGWRRKGWRGSGPWGALPQPGRGLVRLACLSPQGYPGSRGPPGINVSTRHRAAGVFTRPRV